MKRSTLEYYRIFAGWADNVGSLQAAYADFKSLPKDRKKAFLDILHGAALRQSLSDPDIGITFFEGHH